MALDKARRNRLGFAGYVPVLAAMPCSVPAIALALGRNRSGVSVLVRELRNLGLVGKVGEDRSVPRAVTPIWGLGEWPRERFAQRPRAQTIAFAALIQALRMRPASVSDLAAATGLYPTVIRKVIAALRGHGMARIAAYRQRHGAPIALHGLGSGADALLPAALSKSQINARFNARQRVAKIRRERIAAIPRSVFHLAEARP